MSEEPDDRESIYIRVVLKGVALKRFLKLKEHYGHANNTALIRYLISAEYQRLFIKMEDISPGKGKLYQIVVDEREKDP